SMVFLVPDGLLQLVPFAALPTGTRGFLIDEPRVFHALSTERDLVAEPDAAPGRGLLAFGGVDFDRSAAPRADLLASAGGSSLPSGDGARTGHYRGPRSACESFAASRPASLAFS